SSDMLWIKRNLFLTAGGLVAIVLLGVGIYYALNAVSRNSTLDGELEQNTSTLTRLYGQDPFPATTNVDAARRETERVRSAVGRMRKFFAAPPVERVTGLAFRSYRDNLLAELRETAKNAGMETPSGSYAFSFEEQRTRVDFDPRTFPLIPEQMADVRAICNVLAESRVNPLVNIRRSRVSGDDERSSHQSDYHLLGLVTNVAMGVVTSPYEVTFQSLSSELAAVLQKLAASPYGMVVKSVAVDPVGEDTRQAPRRTAAVAPKPGSDRGVTVLNERRFQVNLLIYVVRAVDVPKAAK
ncbi:MAG TPA: Amuc_1100 family pilus-like protein, partial [Gemmatimonadales bacterium]|nr:Amuc_1100 family pilus-like protein [Gemmatimonadales bacterium]